MVLHSVLAQVKEAIEVTHEVGGQGYTFSSGRVGYTPRHGFCSDHSGGGCS